MKRIVFAVIAIICSVAVARAQEADNSKHVFGVRAGVNFAKPVKLLDDGSINKVGIGFHVGGSYEIALTKSRKWYFQTGLNLKYLTSKTAYEGFNLWSDDDTYSTDKYKAMYLEIPAVFTRKIRLTDDWGLQPAIGLSYSFGLSAKDEQEDVKHENNEPDTTKTETWDMFSDGDWIRHAVNVKVGLNFTYKNYLIGAGLSYGVCNLWDLGISFGYNF